MRKMVRLMIVGAVVGTLTGALRAEEGKKPPMPQAPGQHMERMGKALNLTPEQETKIREIQKAMMEKVKAMREEADAQIRATLTDDQKKKFDEWKTKRMERRHERMDEDTPAK